ncbi:MAG TPA: hypothetical protein VGQ93_06740, partial [Lysobacter sp.]|nr:hypothetical protein [Lysobacter sp.]
TSASTNSATWAFDSGRSRARPRMLRCGGALVNGHCHALFRIGDAAPAFMVRFHSDMRPFHNEKEDIRRPQL